MAGTVYALLVGINDYGGNPSPLFGCRADVEAWSQLLRARVGADRYVEEILLDGAATRDAVIERFTTHLGQAGEGDVALFAFSGHGSYEPVEDRFWFLEPTGQNQTLVCADSRSKRAGDLADKELNELIRGVAERGPHTVVLLDCCHSGGGTRDPEGLPDGVRARLAAPPLEPRPLERYLPGVQAAVEAAHARGGSPPSGLAHPRHVALSACEPTQLSKEFTVGDVTRGAFSLALQAALTTLPPGATYRDLIGAAANAVRSRVDDQDPVLFVEGEEPDQPFLGGAVATRPASIALEYERDGWFVDAGRVHGMQPPRDGRTTVLGVRGIAGEEASDEPLGRVRVTRVEPTRSAVEPVDFTPEPGRRYDAVVTEVPAPVASVEVRGAGPAVELIRDAVRDSPRVREATPGEPADELRFVVLAGDDGFCVARADGTPVTDDVPADADGAQRTVRRLDHLARWHEIRDVANPTSPLAGHVQIEIVPAVSPDEAPPPVGDRPAIAPDDTGVVRLGYQRAGDSWTPPAVFIYLHNRSDRNLYCGLLDMTDRFRSNSTLFGVSEVAAGGSTVAFGGRPVAFSVPDERLRSGGTQVRDWLKLIASERRFDPSAFDLPVLDGVLPGDRRWLEAPAVRDAGAAEAGPAMPDWTTATVTVLTERPADGVAVPSAGLVAVSGVVTVEAHPALAAARARVGALDPTSRDADSRGPAPSAIVRDPSVAVPLRLSPAQARGGPVASFDHLEFTGEIDAARVTPDAPLRLELRADVDDGDVVLAVARDGDLFIPLGTGQRSGDGRVDVRLSRLPPGEAGAAGTRGLGRSVRIVFQRILDRRLGRDPSWPRLALARFTDVEGDPSSFELDADPTTVADAVALGGPVLLLVHGLLGDTRAMLPGLGRPAAAAGYSSVLCFDYDSIAAGIEETAAALGKRLAAAGVSADRPVDVVAVSTGALVVRWLVEILDGASLVRRAVLVGPPNAGSPWAGVQGWATSLLGVGINALAQVVWPARALGWLVGALERLDQVIDDLIPGSAVLDALAARPASDRPYHVVAGNASLGAGAEVDRDDGRLGRLLARLGTTAVGWALFRQPNDLVATTASQRALISDASPLPVTEVPCDHFTYFTQPQALDAIAAGMRP